MSSLQKFHRRTNNAPATAASPFTTIGSGSDTVGYWLGAIGADKLVVAPKSTEASLTWGSDGTVRGTINTTVGLANTNTLYAFGQAAHPAAYYCKSLTTGGYNTWYLPANAELVSMYSNRLATPFKVTNHFNSNTTPFWSSTEYNGSYAWMLGLDNSATGGLYRNGRSKAPYQNNVRAVRRSTI